MRLPAALAATVASAALYGLAFPTAKLQLLAWVALVPWLLALRGASLRRTLALGWLWSVASAYAVGDWFAPSFAQYYHRSYALGLLFFFVVSTVTAGPYYTAFAVCYRALVRRRGPTLPLLAGAAWAASELARGRLLEIANPWALSGYSQIGFDRLVQIADLTGVYGIAFLLGAANAALAELVAAALARRPIGSATTGLAVAGGLVIATLGYGEYRLRTVADPPGVAPVRLAMIQANLDLGSLWQPEFYGRNLDTYLQLTQRVLSERPAVVVWPENALTFLLEEEPLYRAAIAAVTAPADVQLVTGGPRAVRASPPAYFNSVFLLSPRGAIEQVYEKERLVPLGEYAPFRRLAVLHERFARVREFSPGTATGPLPTAAGEAGVTICNEAMFPEIAAARVRAGATFLLDPANDTWLTAKFSAQQFDIVTLRTVEQRRWLVRASTAGPSAVVDPLGRIRLRTEFATPAAVTGEIVPRTDATPYAHLGDAFALGCAAVALAGWARAGRA
jgi:apolipoprotein N-acyltransferase